MAWTDEERKAYHREWYHKNKTQRQAQIYANKEKVVAANREKFLALIQAEVCMDCGCEDWRVFQFDHRDPLTKAYTISQMLASEYSWETIMTEINKCDIVCANCHYLRTGSMFGHFKFK